MEKKDSGTKVGIKRMVFWQSRAISSGANLMVIGFLTYYCTDTLNMPPALVGTLLMASKIFDGFTDLFAGLIVDKTNTRLGRGRPYELCVIGMWLCTWLMFSCPPEWSMFAKGAWILAMYSFVNAVFITFLNANNTPYLVRAFERQEQYVAIQSYGSIITMLFVVGVNVSFPMLMAKIAVSPAGWSRLIALYAVPAALIGLLRFFTIPETNKIDAASGEKLRIKDVAALFRTNPYLYIVALVSLVYSVVTNMGAGTYYFKYIIKDLSLMGPMALIQVVMIPVVFLFPPFIKKYSAKLLITLGVMCSCAGLFIIFFANDNFLVYMIGGLLLNVGGVPISMLMTLLIIDCAEFNEWKGIARLEGTMSSLNGFTGKVGGAFGAWLFLALLGAAGYNAQAEIPPDSVIMTIRLSVSFIPLALYLAVIFVLQFYKLHRMMPQIRGENEKRRLRAETT